jgi:hypothetical protein
MRKLLLTLFVLCLALVAFAGCGGGGGTTPVGPTAPATSTGGHNWIPSNDNTPLNPTGSLPGYNGYVPPSPPTGNPTQPDTTPPWVPGQSIFALPVDSGGNGFLTVSNFQPNQEVALVTMNVNRAYLNWSPSQDEIQSFPPFSFSLVFNLVSRRTSSLMDTPAPQAVNLNENPAEYKGLPLVKGKLPVNALYERERKYQMEQTGYDVEAPIKSASVLSKGEVRTFTEIARTIPLPPVLPGSDQQQDLTTLRWPQEYYGQDGRLVAIGARCYVFLTTEINQGFPDGVRFTERRLANFAQEFDINIFPKVQAAFGDILGYNNSGPGADNGPIWKNVDRSIVLTGDDFDDSGNITRQMPGGPDFAIGGDNRVVVAVMNLGPMGAAGLYMNWTRGQYRPPDAEGNPQQPTKSDAWSTLFLDAGIFPADSDDWSQPYAVLAHEFQHKLYADHGMPDSVWLNEGLSQLAVYQAGYTFQSGRTAQILVDQVRRYLINMNQVPIPVDAEKMEGVDVLASYGGRFLFFLYISEHYGPGTIHKFYTLGDADPVALVEKATGDKFEVLNTKFLLANFIDGIYVSADSPLSVANNPWMHYLTFDIRGTVGMDETNRLPGVPTLRLPGEGDTYPVTRSLLPVAPYCAHYTIIGNGDGRDLDLTMFADPNFRFYLLPVNFNTSTNKAEVMEGVTFPND